MGSLDLSDIDEAFDEERADDAVDENESTAGEIVSPLDGQIADIDDVDAMVDMLESVEAMQSQLADTKAKIRVALFNLSEQSNITTKTRRVAGARRVARVELPDESWDKSILREAWNAFPQFRDGYLKIAEIAPQSREVKKLAATATTVAALDTFKKIVLSANRGRQGLPSVKIEK